MTQKVIKIMQSAIKNLDLRLTFLYSKSQNYRIQSLGRILTKNGIRDEVDFDRFSTFSLLSKSDKMMKSDYSIAM